MPPTIDRPLTIASPAPTPQAEVPPDQASLADIADSVDWTELLDALVSDFALALANGEAQYLHGVSDLMGRVSEQ